MTRRITITPEIAEALREAAKTRVERKARKTGRIVLPRRTLITGGAAAVLLAAVKAQADTPFTTFAFPGTGSTASRTTPNRIADTLNAIEFSGVDPTGNTDSTNGVKAALAAMWGTSPNHANDLYFPAGRYVCNLGSAIDISNPNNGLDSGRIFGAGKAATVITGTVNNNFMWTRRNSAGGPSEISDMTIVNGSTNVGTGALRFLNSNGATLRNLQLTGQIGLDASWNSFNLNVFGCDFAPISDNIIGTSAILSDGCNLIGARGESFDIFLAAFGSDAHLISGNSVEECNIAWAGGLFQGWGLATISGTTMTVLSTANGGEISPSATPSSFVSLFPNGASVFGPGITSNPWATLPGTSGTTIVQQLTGTNPNWPGLTGLDGTYQLSQSYTISSPIPVFTRIADTLEAAEISDFETEGCIYALWANNMSGCSVCNGDLTGAVTEGAASGGGKGLTAHSGIYIFEANACTFKSMRSGLGTYKAAIYFDPQAITANTSFIDCLGFPTANAVSGTGATISGTTMTIDSQTGGQFGVGMTITGVGVTSNTVILANGTGAGGAGTYTVNNSQTVGPTTLTGVGGAGWTLPTSASSYRAGLKLYNCDDPGLLLTFNELPGQPGCDNNNIVLAEGQTFRISDSPTATTGNFGASVTTGGGSHHNTLTYNGSNWIIVG